MVSGERKERAGDLFFSVSNSTIVTAPGALESVRAVGAGAPRLRAGELVVPRRSRTR